MITTLTPEKCAKMLWIGGSPCSGKSTCAESLVKEYNLTIYKCDDYFYEHVEKADLSVNPALHRLKGMTWDEIWMRPVDVLLQDEINIYHEEFAMIIEDLTELDILNGCVIEGAALLPELLNKIGVKQDQVLYLLPTQEFQYEKYSKREFVKGILKDCVNPEAAFTNWMERDHEMSNYIRQKAMAFNYPSLIIDGNISLAGIFDKAKIHFQRLLPEPR